MVDWPVEQLWYTWSEVGIDSMRVGFRVRAASEGLRDIYSERMRSLDRYWRYQLPKGVLSPPDINPDEAPACLSLIATEKERLLVHKVYTGKDVYGRYGTFFIHLLVGLPDEFSVRDAISLWESPFWQVSDRNLNRGSTVLDRVSLQSLMEGRKDLSPILSRSRILQTYLPFVLQAYLTIAQEDPGQEPQKLYIAAPDDDVALLILGIASSLPSQLLKNLTFSTYEADVEKAETNIVGTCWLTVPEAGQLPQVGALLPNWCYEEHAAINCYTATLSQLENKPFVAEFARDATARFFGEKIEEFEDFLKETQRLPTLDIDTFLLLYKSLVIQARNPTPSDIEAVLNARTALLSLSQYEFSAIMLSKRRFREELMTLVIREPDWWQNHGRVPLLRLSQQSAMLPLLAEALSILAKHAFSTALDFARRSNIRPNVTATKGIGNNEEMAIHRLIDLARCAAPPKRDPEMWIAFLRVLGEEKLISALLNNYWSVYATLIQIWAEILPRTPQMDALITPFLSVSWANFGAFLSLGLPTHWNELAAKAIISQTSLNAELVSVLNNRYHEAFEGLFQQLAQERSLWSTAEALFARLVDGGYRKRIDLLLIMLDSAMGQYGGQEVVERLLRIARLTKDEQATILERYGKYYISRYPQSQVLLNYVQDYLNYLPAIDINLFKSITPEVPSSKERFLGFLHFASFPYSAQLIHDWYVVAEFLRSPAIIISKQEEVVESMIRLLTSQKLNQPSRTNLISEFARALSFCIEDTNRLIATVNRLHEALLPAELLEVLRILAMSAGEVFRQGSPEKAVFIPYIQLAIAVQHLIEGESEQANFVERFLDTTFEGVNVEVIDWLDAQMREQPSAVYAQWRQYVSQRYARLSLFERIALWLRRLKRQ